MADLKFPSAPFDAASWPRFVAANRNAHVSADHDSGWQPTANGKVWQHNLNVVPSEVSVYASNDPNGVGFQPDTYTNCNRSSITVNGALNFFRVRINKGKIAQGV